LLGPHDARSGGFLDKQRSPVDLFLMTNSFGRGGSERHLTVVAQNLPGERFRCHTGCIRRVIPEALAAGLPVVAYRVGSNAELINDMRGILVNAGEEEAFANAVVKLLSQPAMREELRRNGRQFAHENFGLESVLVRYRDCYVRFLEKKSVRNSLAR